MKDIGLHKLREEETSQEDPVVTASGTEKSESLTASSGHRTDVGHRIDTTH